MHVEPPKEPLASLREFGLHYLMIVVSILTALGLEEALRFRHDSEAARLAEQSIEREVFANLQDLRDAIKQNEGRIAAMHKLGDALAEDIRRQPAADLQKKVKEELDGKLSIGLTLPGQSHEAWDVAVASQAAVHIPRDKLEAYAASYSMVRDTITAANAGIVMMDGPRLIDMISDIEIGVIDPKRSFELIRQSEAVNGSALGNLKAAESEITKALDKAGVHKS